MRGAKQNEMFEISDLRREILHLRFVCLFPAPGGGGGYSYIFGGFHKTEYVWGYKDFVDIFWGHQKIGLYDAF